MGHVLDAVDEQIALNAMRESADPLYHVTYYNRLEAIAKDGLQPNRARSLGAPAYDAHARGKLFLTEKYGVPFWMHVAETFAEANSDTPYQDGLAPVTLRVDPECILGPWRKTALEQDLHGSQDAGEDAWMSREALPPECLEVFTGTSWEPVDEGRDTIDPLLAFDALPVPDEEKDEDGEPEQYYYIKNKSPLNPFPED